MTRRNIDRNTRLTDAEYTERFPRGGEGCCVVGNLTVNMINILMPYSKGVSCWPTVLIVIHFTGTLIQVYQNNGELRKTTTNKTKAKQIKKAINY